jgi:hypothetical protein
MPFETRENVEDDFKYLKNKVAEIKKIIIKGVDNIEQVYLSEPSKDCILKGKACKGFSKVGEVYEVKEEYSRLHRKLCNKLWNKAHSNHKLLLLCSRNTRNNKWDLSKLNHSQRNQLNRCNSNLNIRNQLLINLPLRLSNLYSRNRCSNIHHSNHNSLHHKLHLLIPLSHPLKRTQLSLKILRHIHHSNLSRICHQLLRNNQLNSTKTA